MDQKSKAKKIVAILNKHFPAPNIPLKHKDPYTLLISVVLSAQCTDERVNQITPLLFSLADHPKKMASLDAQEVESVIRPCGLAPRKSKAIVELSRILMEQFSGQVPESFEHLEALPGVGHKTASVVMSQAFSHPAFPVDTHIHRCAKRWGLSTGKSVEKTERDLKELFPKKIWNRLHLQIIYFARKYCPAKKHIPKECPICSWII